jgi:hypothetical protein
LMSHPLFPCLIINQQKNLLHHQHHNHKAFFIPYLYHFTIILPHNLNHFYLHNL